MIEEKHSKFSLTNDTVFINLTQCRVTSWVFRFSVQIHPELCPALQAPSMVKAL